MVRDRRHLYIKEIGSGKAYSPKPPGFSNDLPSNVVDRLAHAQALLHALDHLPDPTRDGLPGIYLDVSGRPNEPMVSVSLNKSGLKLLNVHEGRAVGEPSRATVYASPKGLESLRNKLNDFKNPAKDSKPKPGKLGQPRNAPLVQSIGAIVEAGLRHLWRSPMERFPQAGVASWEVWLEPESVAAFIAGAAQDNVVIGAERLEFPEDVVVIAHSTAENLARAVKRLGCVKALAQPASATDYFDNLEPEDQVAHVDELLARTTFSFGDNPNYITLLDRGVSLGHPLIAPALDPDDRHVADFAWSLDDLKGHGTSMAGLALYGDLGIALQTTMPVSVRHRLESSKILPDAGVNPHHLLGVFTKRGIDAAEVQGGRRRVFTMAVTTPDDSPHDGAPTSWSTEVDQLVAGVSGAEKTSRLLIVCAGNTDQNLLQHLDYLPVCDKSEIEAPAQAWNAICVGAYTEKVILPPGEPGTLLAAFGDLSPSSCTASWNSQWPIKPDVVLEGGNLVMQGSPPALHHPALSLLSTSRHYPQRAFTPFDETSAATALAAHFVSNLWADYPQLRPETIRGLFVSSARWTSQMKSHLPAGPKKGDFDMLFRRYGFGVPDMERARRSASNALTLIVEDKIVPYRKPKKDGVRKAKLPSVNNEMKLFNLPWPSSELRKLHAEPVKLRVTLSTYIEPNPSEVVRGHRYQYASHNLRFRLNHADETDVTKFIARVRRETDDNIADDDWDFGSNRRTVGSIQIDQLTCPASDLARRNLLAVYPVGGWWKTQAVDNPEQKVARFSLIVEIDTGTVDADLYSEVSHEIDLLNAVQNVV